MESAQASIIANEAFKDGMTAAVTILEGPFNNLAAPDHKQQITRQILRLAAETIKEFIEPLANETYPCPPSATTKATNTPNS